MKSTLLLLLGFFCSATTLFCQKEDLEKIKAPSSPAAAIIGVQPTTVLSPKSYDALETSVFSNFYNKGNFLIPNDFGLEFSPYWAMDHPMSIEKYLYPGFLECLWRNFSISVASTQNYILKDSVKSTALGFGFRTTIYINDPTVKKIMNAPFVKLKRAMKIRDLIAGYAERFYRRDSEGHLNSGQFVDRLIDTLYTKKSILDFYNNDRILMKQELSGLAEIMKMELPAYSKEPGSQFMDSVSQQILRFSKMTYYHDTLQSYVMNRPGFKMDIAAAFALDFPSNDFNFSSAPQQSLWVTPSYRFRGKASFLEVLGVLRYNWYNVNFYQQYFQNKETYEHNFDYGLSLNLLFKKISVHLEAVGQYSNTTIEKTTDANGITTTKSKTKSDFQYIGTFSYQINKKLILSYSFGKQFQPILTANGTLISVLSLNFGFGGPTKDNLTNF